MNQEQNDAYEGTAFSIVPINLSGRTLGVLSLTDYPNETVSSPFRRNLFQVLVHLASKAFADLLFKVISHIEIETSVKTGGLVTSLNSMLARDSDTWAIQALNEITETLKCSGFIASVDSDSRELKILSCAGYGPATLTYLNSISFYAKENNINGPVAIAHNLKSVVVVEDITWIQQSIKSKTDDFFKLNGTQSCLVIPIVLAEKEGELASWGLIWLESERISHFRSEQTNSYEQILQAASQSLTRLILSENLSEKSDLLSTFIPKAVAEKLSKGAATREEEIGHLLMIDLRGSTKMASELGSATYLSKIAVLQCELERQLGIFGFQLQLVNWDAFYFTKAADEPFAFHTLHELQTLIDETVKSWRKNTLGYKNATSPLFRACLDYGDISRDLSPGPNSTWTIVGDTMARVCKLEQECKKMEGTFYVTQMVKIFGSSRDSTLFPSQSLPGEKVLILESATETLLRNRSA
jgi:hypothetical protein